MANHLPAQRIITDQGSVPFSELEKFFAGLAVLLGDVNGPFNANHVDSLSGPGAGVPVVANADIEFAGGSGTPATSGALRFPAPANGAGNSYEAMAAFTAVGQPGPHTLHTIRFFENPVDNASLVIGEPGWYFSILSGGTSNGAVGVSTNLTPAGGFADCYFGCRGDGLAFLNCPDLGQPLSRFFERSDALVVDYALRDEYDHDGTTVIRFGPLVTSAQGRFFDGAGDRRIWEAAPGGGGGSLTLGDAALQNTFVFGKVSTFGSALYGVLADTGIGYAALRTNGAPVVQASFPAANQRLAGLASAGVVSAAVVGANPGDLVVHIGQAAVAPTGNPVTGFLLFVDPADGILKARGSTGTITPLALP
jgi:hypothetical protein